MAGMRELALADIYARACPSGRLPADLEARLQAILARVAQAWPDLMIDPSRLVEAIARVAGDDVEGGLADLYVEDLALAVACANGVPNALAHCERACAGAIYAALFLRRFVPSEISWAHLDTWAWRDAQKPGRPKGGEALGLRAVFAAFERRYLQR